MSGARTAERGAALLIVMVAVAVLTALAANLAYEARVSIQIAANARNELQATYLAKSGVTLSRLVLSFQRELDGATGAAASAGMAVPRLQVWRLAPVSAELADALLGGASRSRPESGEPARRGPAPGAFEVAIGDEGSKVNAQLEGGATGLLPSQVQAFWQLVCDPRWDPLFDREDANGLRVSRTDLLVYLRDWVDDEVPPASSALAASLAGCAIDTPAKPFEPGFADENFPYDRGEDRYRTKNARMDSLDELYLVAGIGDAFMAAFGDALTVYLARDDKPNVNTSDPLTLHLRARQIALPPDQAALGTHEFLAELVRLNALATRGGYVFLTSAQFRDLVEQAGVRTNPALFTGNAAPFTDASTVFRVRAAGRAGDVTKTLDVVVRFDKPPAVVVTPGKILHWREE